MPLEDAQLPRGGVAVHVGGAGELLDGEEAVALDEEQPEHRPIGEDEAARAGHGDQVGLKPPAAGRISLLGGSSDRGRPRCGRFGGAGTQHALARARKAEELSLPLLDELRVEGTHELLLEAWVLGGVVEGGAAGDRVALLRRRALLVVVEELLGQKPVRVDQGDAFAAGDVLADHARARASSCRCRTGR